MQVNDIEAKRAALTQKLNNKIKKLQRLLTNIESDKDRFLNILKKEMEAELLKANLHRAKKGMAEIEVKNFFVPENQTVLISLEKEKTPLENLNAKFEIIKKARRGLLKIEPRLRQIEAQLSNAKGELDLAKEAIFEELSALETHVFPKLKHKDEKKNKTRMPFKKFLSFDETVILVGRSAKDSDTMLRLYANGNDWWFHVDGMKGAHVIAKCKVLSEDVLKASAMLAAWNSNAKKDSKAIIKYTQVKFLKKAKKLKPGQVLVSKEKNITISIDNNYLNLLLKRRLDL